MDWPDPLVAELAERRCILFLGAGASAASSDSDGNRPPTWTRLLEEACDLVSDTAVVDLAQQLIQKEQMLDAAEVVFSRIEAAEIRTFLRERLLVPQYQPSTIHQVALDLDPKVLITTNYDRIYDEFCTQGSARDGYSIRNYYDANVLDEIRSTARVVIKAHGCITDTNRIVLTRSQYFQARAENRGFYEILDSLFLVNTLLFVGYSVADPDIQLVLENAHIHFPSRHPHYALVPEGRHEALRESMRRTYNLRLLEYDAPEGDHAEGLRCLEELRDNVLSYRSTYLSQ